jgi:hypothetical protein
MERVDPEGARAEKIKNLQEQIGLLGTEQAKAAKAKQFAIAGKLEDEIQEIRLKLDDLTMPAETGSSRTMRMPSPGSGTSILVALIGVFFAVHSAYAAACYNTETGKTSGSVRVAVAIVNTPTTFACVISGSTVELVDADNPSTVLLTPSVSKQRPLTFTFNPTSEGRMIVKVDGHLYNQMAVRSRAIAEGINDAVDLSHGGISSGADTAARRFLEGLACGASPNPGCIAEVRKAWGSGKGTSAFAGAFARNTIIEKIFKDDRFVALKQRADAAQAQADAAKLAADAAEAKAGSTTGGTGGISDARIGQIVDGKITPLTTAIQSAQATGDQAKIEAGRATRVATANATATASILNAAAAGKKLPKATATAWEQKLQQACVSAGVSCPADQYGQPKKQPAAKKTKK